MKRFKNYFRNIVFEVVDEFHGHLYTRYTLIDAETDKSLDEYVELAHKPAKGDVIVCTDSIVEKDHFKFKVQKIELSGTGFTGNIYGEILK